MTIKMVAKSDTGKLRKANEDYCGIFDEEKLALVCDGMGGHKAGAHASRLATSTIRYAYGFLEDKTLDAISADMDDDTRKIAGRLISAIRLANRHIFNRALKVSDYHGMGTTVSALSFTSDGLVCVAHVGDSRVYRFRQNDIMEQLTEDHSWINELIQDKEIKKEEALHFKKKNVITRALGLGAKVRVDLKIDNIEKEDLFLLCSDGLTDLIDDDQIKYIIQTNKDDLQNMASHLIDAANKAGGSDNISVVLVKIYELNNDCKTIKPISVALKNENNEISIIENKVLRQEFTNRKFSNIFSDKFSEIWENKFCKICLIMAILATTLFCVRYSFLSNFSMPSSIQLEEIANSKLIAKDIYQESKNSTKMDSQNSTKEENTILFSENVNNALNKEEISVKSLKKDKFQKIGQIYIVNVENLRNYDKTFIYLNNKLIGRTSNYIDNGIRVRPGTYNIAIKNTNKHILFQQKNIKIVSGDIKAIEYKSLNRN